MNILKCILVQKVGFLKYKSGRFHGHKMKIKLNLFTLKDLFENWERLQIFFIKKTNLLSFEVVQGNNRYWSLFWETFVPHKWAECGVLQFNVLWTVHRDIQGVSGGTVNILGFGSMDYCE